ncbi:hypothetical protein Fmac_031445 [Flemingia macrophylla]|uniref:WRKY domain-containing protein n=1 Tax=Flemingia macrophylla TaxID=520843 RepID=A0ABD1L239_9FABA
MKNVVCPKSESVSDKMKRVMIKKELVKGQEAASQLKLLLLHNPFHCPFPFDTQQHSLSSHQLIANVLTCFTQALSIITDDHHCSGSQSKKTSQKGGRGRYLRRRSALTWTILSSNNDDNHAWRKYGQKEILNSEFPRSYFRCCHKYDQGCGAIKQVQQYEKNPDMYQTTYIGMHTCNAKPPKATHSTIESANWESHLLNSDRDSMVTNVYDHQSPTLTIKQDFSKRNTSSDDDVTDFKLDPCLLSDFKEF